MRTPVKILLALFMIVCLAIFSFIYIFATHGVEARNWDSFDLAKVEFDGHGIPTITAENWELLIEAQGYVVASERLFQMELQRRAASGGLSKVFGRRAKLRDEKRWKENWLGVADRAAKDLPLAERKFCDAYVRGVNRFITEQEGRWGVEFTMMQFQPERWKCRDTMLVAMLMADRLTGSSEREFHQWQWRKHLSPAFAKFLYPNQHPWNRPLFGRPTRRGIYPDQQDFLPNGNLEDIDETVPLFRDPLFRGSNNWAYRGKEGAFLANDPHLGHQVPQTWFAVRLKIDPQHWAVGLTLPGIPGVLLGMNQNIAWAFTNTGEDVDDILIETLNEDRSQFLLSENGGTKQWENVTEVISKRHNGDEQIDYTARFTSRGPIIGSVEGSDHQVYVRQWLGFVPGKLRMPLVQLNQAADWQEYNQVMDQFLLPSQNTIMMDRQGSFGFRVSGTGIERSVNGVIPQSAILGAWQGLEKPEARLRRWVPFNSATGKNHIATANQRIWTSQFGHNWSSDDRVERINEFLDQRPDYGVQDMERLQRDTQGRFAMLLLQWLQEQYQNSETSVTNLYLEWDQWSGASVEDVSVFGDAVQAETMLATIVLARVRDHFIDNDLHDKLPFYKSFMQRAWMIELLSHPKGMQLVGLESQAVAKKIVDSILRLRQRAGYETYPEHNRWRSQHPFVGRIPLLGGLFRIAEHGQAGHPQLVNAEGPRFGPSFRAVWNLTKPFESTWIMPVGQSGHVGSPHFKDLQSVWFEGRSLPVFPAGGEGWQ